MHSVKYLGITSDANMKWNKHIEYLINKTRYLIFIFSKISNIMDINTLHIIYYALFYSVINYGIITLGGVYQTNLQILQTVQTRILKIINKDTFQTNTPLNLIQLFAYKSLRYNYEKFKQQYSTSSSTTRRKVIIPPKYDERLSTKSSYIKAINISNKLLNEKKTLDLRKKSNKKKLKYCVT